MSLFDEIFETLGRMLSSSEDKAASSSRSSTSNYGGLGISKDEYQRKTLEELLALKLALINKRLAQTKKPKHKTAKYMLQRQLIKDILYDLDQLPNQRWALTSRYLLIETALRFINPAKLKPAAGLRETENDTKCKLWWRLVKSKGFDMDTLGLDAFHPHQDGSLHNILISAMLGEKQAARESSRRTASMFQPSQSAGPNPESPRLLQALYKQQEARQQRMARR